jgi:hypothetical protein
MAITKTPYLAQPAFNEVVVTDDASDTLYVTSVSPAPALPLPVENVTLRHVITQGGANFDLKGFLSNLFYDRRVPVDQASSAHWAYQDMRLMALFNFGDDPTNYEVLNAVKQPGETLDLLNEPAHPVLSRRAKHFVRHTAIPCYDGYPVGCSLLWRKMYQTVEVTDPNVFSVKLKGVVPGKAYLFPVLGEGVISWGDGSQDEAHVSEYRTHVYVTGGTKQITYLPIDDTSIHETYQTVTPNAALDNYKAALTEVVKFSPRMYYATFYDCYNLVSVPAWEATNVTSCNFMFAKCTSLQSLPDDFFNTVPDRKTEWTFMSTFQECSSLRAIPTRFFAKAGNIRTLKSCFYYCTNLAEIPSGLFPPHTGAGLTTDCSHMFDNCWSITAIPSDLFSRLSVSDFSYTFYNCGKLSSIPNAIFTGQDKATKFSHVFSHNGSVTSIPATLFDDCISATDMDNIFFNDIRIAAIPETLFKYNTGVTNFNGAFSGCQKVTYIPPKLFENNTKATSFNNTFDGLTVTSIPVELFTNCVLAKTVQGCFARTVFIKEIPVGLFSNNPDIIDFVECFSFCTTLTSVPADIFTHSTGAEIDVTGCFNQCYALSDISALTLPASVTSARFMFWLCEALTTIPSGLFAQYAGVSYAPDFSDMFEGSGIRSIPDDLFAPFARNAHAPKCRLMFTQCLSLTSVPVGLLSPLTQAVDEFYAMFTSTGITEIPNTFLDLNRNLVDVSSMFAGCMSLKTIPGTLFDQCPNLRFVNSTFSGCELESISPEMFRYNDVLQDVRHCFAISYAYPDTTGSTPVTADGEKLWERRVSGGGLLFGDKCFAGRTGLSDYNEIPANWK